MRRSHEKARADQWIYLMRAGMYAKVGIAVAPARRLKEVQTCCPLEVTLERVLWVNGVAADLEDEIHSRLTWSGLHLRGEWFKPYSKAKKVFDAACSGRTCDENPAILADFKKISGV